MPGIIYIGADNDVILDSLKNSRTDAYVNSGATVTFTLYRILTKDAVTNSTTTLTSAIAPFVAGDAARSVVVLGAAANGGDLRTTISTFTAANSVVLGAAASVTASHHEVRLSVTNATTITMAYVTDSNGKYRGTLDDDVVLQNGATYGIEISVDAGSDVKDFRSFDVVAKYRE